MYKRATGFYYTDNSPICKYDIVEMFIPASRWPIGIFAIGENSQTGEWFLIELGDDVVDPCPMLLTEERATRLVREGGLYENTVRMDAPACTTDKGARSESNP